MKLYKKIIKNFFLVILYYVLKWCLGTNRKRKLRGSGWQLLVVWSEVGRKQNNNNCAEMELCEILYNKAEYIETVC